MNELQVNPILRKISSCVSLLVIASLLLYAVPSNAQVQSPPPKGLRIMILSGEGALNNIEARTAREPIVQVQDENHKPVAGAAVLFTIHGGKNGSGGSFNNGSTTFSTVTNANGIAIGRGFIPNNTVGAFQITITASYGTLTASSVINENNVLPQVPHNQVNPQSPGNAPYTFKPGPLHGIFRPLRWILTKPGVLAVGGVAVASVITVVVITQPKSPTQILTGSSTVGPPSGQHRIGFTVHFGKQ
jgi:hypothetical protein